MNEAWKLARQKQPAGLEPRERLIYIALIERTSERTWTAWPSITALAEFAFCSKRTAIRIVKKLEARGLVEKVRRGGGTISETTASGETKTRGLTNEFLVDLARPHWEELNGSGDTQGGTVDTVTPKRHPSASQPAGYGDKSGGSTVTLGACKGDTQGGTQSEVNREEQKKDSALEVSLSGEGAREASEKKTGGEISKAFPLMTADPAAPEGAAPPPRRDERGEKPNPIEKEIGPELFRALRDARAVEQYEKADPAGRARLLLWSINQDALAGIAERHICVMPEKKQAVALAAIIDAARRVAAAPIKRASERLCAALSGLLDAPKGGVA